MLRFGMKKMWNVSWCTRRFWAQDSSSALQTLGDGTCIASLAGSNTKNAQLLARVFLGKFQINTIVPKNCAPKTYQSFQTPGHGTCIALLAGSVTKRAELLARIFQDKFHQRDCPKKQVPKTSQTVWKRWAKGHAGHCIGKSSLLDAWFSLPLQRSKLNENPSIGYASAWTDRWGNSLGRALLGGEWHWKCGAVGTGFTQSSFYTEELYTEELYTEEDLFTPACTQGRLYTQSFYTGKVLHTEAFTQRSLYTE